MNKWMITGVALSFMLVSCSKDDDNTPQSGNNNENGGAVISFSSSISPSIVVEVTPVSRAPLATFSHNDQLGIFGIPAIEGNPNIDCDLFNKRQEKDFQPNLFNACYTFAEGYPTLQSENIATFPNLPNAGLMLYGYYPYTEEAAWHEVNQTPQWAIPWKLVPSDMSATKDYMFTGPMPTWYSKVGLNPVVLNFQHAFGRLDLCFYSTSGEVCNAGYRIQSVTVYCHTGESGWMSVTNGSLSLGNPKDLTCVYPTNNVGIAYSIPGESAAKFMFPPETTWIEKITCQVKDGGNNPREFTIYNHTYGYKIPIKRGKTTLMRINFLPRDATFSGPANVDSWTGNGDTILDKEVKLQ